MSRNTRLEELILRKSFKVRDGELLLNQEALRITLAENFAKPAKGPEKFRLDYLETEMYKHLFDNGDSRKLLNKITAPNEHVIEKQRRERVEESIRNLVKSRVQHCQNHIAFYDYLPQIDRESATLLAAAHCVAILSYEISEYIEVLKKVVMHPDLFDLQTADYIHSVVLCTKNVRAFRKSSRVEEIPVLLLPELEHVDGSRRENLPQTLRDYIFYLHLSSRKSSKAKYGVYYQLLINFVLDNPDIPKEQLFIIHFNDIFDMLFCEDDNISSTSEERERLKVKIERRINLPVYIPHQVVCFSCINLSFYNPADNAVIGSEQLLVVYDHASKFIYECVYLTGAVEQFMQAFHSILVHGNNSVPSEIWYVQILSSYIQHFGNFIQELKLRPVMCEVQNQRFQHFLKFLPLEKVGNLEYEIFESESECDLGVMLQTTNDIAGAIENFPERMKQTFNKHKESVDDASYADAFNVMSKADLTKVSEYQFAIMFYNSIDCELADALCMLRIPPFVYLYDIEHSSTYKGPGKLLFDDSKFDADVYVIYGNNQMSRAALNRKFIDDGSWQLSSREALPKVIDARREVSKKYRKEFGISEDKPIVRLEFSSHLRKLFRKLRPNG